jgi:hypothetical protein
MSDVRKSSTIPLSTTTSDDWREIAARAANEKDPTKLLQLVEHLCEELEQQSSARKIRQMPRP